MESEPDLMSQVGDLPSLKKGSSKERSVRIDTSPSLFGPLKLKSHKSYAIPIASTMRKTNSKTPTRDPKLEPTGLIKEKSEAGFILERTI